MGGEEKGMDPSLALSAVPRSELLDRLVTPRWYHPAVGAVLGLLVASWATRSVPVVLTAAGVWFVAAVALPRLYRRATGVWFAGDNPPGAARAARRLAWTVSAGLAVGVLSTYGSLWPLALVGAVGCAVLTVRLGQQFDAALRHGLEADPELAARLEERAP